MALRDYKLDIPMTGTGYKQISVPAGYKYVAVINGTDNATEVYSQWVTTDNKSGAALVIKVPLYTMMTVPIGIETQFTLLWTDGGAVGTKIAQLIFSETNLNINGSIGSPASGGNMVIIADNVGLARQAQLPAALSTGGNLKVAIEESDIPLEMSIADPLPAGGNTIGNVGIVGPLPAGGNTIGTVNVASSPGVPLHVQVAGPDPLPVSIDAPDPLNVAGLVSTIPQATGIKTGSVSMTGSRVQLPSQAVIDGVCVLQADPSNTNEIYVGDSTVLTGAGFVLMPGDKFSFPCDNLNKLYAVGLNPGGLIWMVGV